jgi:hypothetical protein
MEPKYVTFEQEKWLNSIGFDVELRETKYGHEMPEQWQVVEWLLEKHGIWICVNIAIDDTWYFEMYNLKDKRNAEIIIEDENITYFHKTPQEAYSAAFDYIKDNDLI